MKVLVVYATTEGHTRKIAHRIADWVGIRGHSVAIIDASDIPEAVDPDAWEAYILVGAIHMEKHQASLMHFAKDHLDRLQDCPSALVSASLTAALEDADSQATARSYIGTFIEQTGWIPTMATPVAGALMYTHYDFFKRFILKMMAQKQGGPIDTTKDFEFTDYEALEKFTIEFLSLHVEHTGSVGEPAVAQY